MSGSEGGFQGHFYGWFAFLVVCIVQNLSIDRAALKLSFSFYS
jgi:hypothetical protein